MLRGPSQADSSLTPEALDRLRPFLKGLPVTTNDVEAHKNKVLLALNNLRKAAQEYAGRKKGKSSGDAAYGDEAKKADWLDSEGMSSFLRTLREFRVMSTSANFLNMLMLL